MRIRLFGYIFIVTRSPKVVSDIIPMIRSYSEQLQEELEPLPEPSVVVETPMAAKTWPATGEMTYLVHSPE